MSKSYPVSFVVSLIAVLVLLLTAPSAQAQSQSYYPNIPQTCPATACRAGLTCKDGNCLQCGGDEIFPPAEESSLRKYAEKRGILVSAIRQLRRKEGTQGYDQHPAFGPEYLETLRKEFNSIQLATYMKELQPNRDDFRFSIMDEVIQYAQANKMRIWAKVLIYGVTRYAVPSWLNFDDGNCGGWGDTSQKRQELDEIMRKHIQTVMQHAGDNIYAWVVVNEGIIQTNGAGCWLRVLGDDFIPNAFTYARQANPNALLILDDSFGRGGVDRDKTDVFFDTLIEYKQNGIAIDVAGIHMRLDLRELRWDTYQDEFRYFLDRAKTANVQVWITEMDVYQGGEDTISSQQEALLKQKEVYKNIISICLDDPNCTMLGFTHISDKANYWKSVYPNLRPIPKPLLFDENYQRKPAYYGVMEALRENTTRACKNSNLLDLLSFRRLWARGDQQADANGDGRANILDYLEILREWLR